MKYIKSYNESKVQEKMDFLELISVDLSDMGLIVDIHKGKNFITMVITDLNNIVTGELFKSDIIKEFELKLSDVEMKPRQTSGGDKVVIFCFDKHGKMTDSSFI